MQAKNGLPVSRRALFRTAVGDKEGDNTRDRFRNVLLDSLKKDRETGVKEGLA